MVEDMRHLETLHLLAGEIQALLNEYNRRASGETNKATLVALRLEQNAALVALLEEQRRALEFMMGKEPKPKVQFAESVLVGVVGGGSP